MSKEKNKILLFNYSYAIIPGLRKDTQNWVPRLIQKFIDIRKLEYQVGAICAYCCVIQNTCTIFIRRDL